jgi:type II secretory pathway component GspD/PulD (secretin)
MNLVRFACVVALFGLSGGAIQAQSPATASASAERTGMPLELVITAVANKTGKKFLIDPRVHADINLVGQDLSNISYNDLLTILLVNGLTAAEYGGYVSVMPDAGARQTPSPLLSGKESHPDAQIVTKVITVKTIPAVQLVPILRPMIPPIWPLCGPSLHQQADPRRHLWQRSAPRIGDRVS